MRQQQVHEVSVVRSSAEVVPNHDLVYELFSNFTFRGILGVAHDVGFGLHFTEQVRIRLRIVLVAQPMLVAGHLVVYKRRTPCGPQFLPRTVLRWVIL